MMIPEPKAVELLHKFGNPQRLLTTIMPQYGLVIGVFKSNHGIDLYDVVTAFTIGGVWHASMDRHNASSEDTIKAIAERTNT